jgi:hypothetical protein
MMKTGIIIKGLLLIIGLLFAYSLVNRFPDIDDAWLGENAYWQSKIGYAKSELMHGITQQEVRFLPNHKLLTLEGAGFIRMFGFSLVTLKAVSLAWLIIFLVIFHRYACKRLLSPQEFWLAVLLLMSNAMIFQYAFVFRPEIAVMTLGFISYILLEKALGKPQKEVLWVVLSGIAAGLCVSTHLNGIIFLGAGSLLLVWNRRYLQGIIFGASALPAIALYFYDFTPAYNFGFWWYQLNETPAFDRAHDLPAALYYLKNLGTEHLRLFHSPEVISLSVLVLALVVALYRPLKAYRTLLRYTFLLVIILGLFAVHKTPKYMMLYMPFLALIIVLSFRHLLNKDLAASKIFNSFTYKQVAPVFIGLLAACLTLNIASDVPVAFRKYDPEANRRLVETCITAKTDTCRIVAPMTFIFNEIENFRSIQGDLCYTELQKNDSTVYGKGFLERTTRYGTDYIILTGEFIHRLGADRLTGQDLADARFTVIRRQDGLLILQKLPSPGR